MGIRRYMINQLLKKKVKQSKYTSKQIATAVGISRQQLYNYTDDGQVPNAFIANSLARFFDMHTEELFPNYNKTKDERYGK